MNIKIGGLYCISDGYFERYSACEWVLHNHTEGRTDGLGYRPHVIALHDPKDKNVYWAVPLAHNVEKYQAVYDRKVAKDGFCDNIAFARILGNSAPSAALAQNMIPVTEGYIEKPYASLASGKPRELSAEDRRAVCSMARKTLAKHRAGIHAIHPPIDTIYEDLQTGSAIAQGIKALRAAPLATGYVLVKETPSAKTTVAVIGGQGGTIDDLKLVQIDEKPGERPHRKITPIAAPHFARKIEELGSVRWTKAIPRKEPLFESSPKTDRSGFDAALDKAEKNAARSAGEFPARISERARDGRSRNQGDQR